jgi:hypothetical protein
VVAFVEDPDKAFHCDSSEVVTDDEIDGQAGAPPAEGPDALGPRTCVGALKAQDSPFVIPSQVSPSC